MKKLLSLSLIIIIFIILLCSCSNNNGFAGVYLLATSSNDNAIILFEDGTFQYSNFENGTWSVLSDGLIMTCKINLPSYYLDVYLDNKLTKLEMMSIEASCKQLESVTDCSLNKDTAVIRLKIQTENSMQQTQKTVSKISGVLKVETFISETSDISLHFRIIDDCLVSSNGAV